MDHLAFPVIRTLNLVLLEVARRVDRRRALREGGVLPRAVLSALSSWEMRHPQARNAITLRLLVSEQYLGSMQKHKLPTFGHVGWQLFRIFARF